MSSKKSDRKRLNVFFLLLVVLSIPLTLYLLQEGGNILTTAFGKKADLVVIAGVSYSDGPSGVWKNLAQGGEEKENMLTSVIEQTKQLTPSYIRIDHIFDHYEIVSIDPTGNLVFNWTKLDKIISDIVATGAKPFLSLSFMPPALSKSGSVTDISKDWRLWKDLVQKTIEHVSGKNALAISNVYYEVWSEPDLFGDFKLSGDKNYLTLYLHSARAANNASNVLPFKLGGPATTNLYRNWFYRFLQFAKENNLRLDFYSWHKYSEDVNQFEKDRSALDDWLSDFPEFRNKEFIISEIGHNSEVDERHDGKFSAIFTLASSALLESRLNRVFLFEIKDGPGEKKYWGRWGILTHEKFGEPTPKPRYRAIQFLNQMLGDRVLVGGQGTWVKAFAKNERGIIRVLVVNYDPRAKHTEAVPITFLNLPTTNFTWRRIDFLGGKRERTITIPASVWSTVEFFEPNSAAIFEVIPI